MTKVLIIDPARAVRNSLKDLLEHEGYVVETAESVVSSPILSSQPGFDLILCGDPQGFGANAVVDIPWIALSDIASIELAVKMVRLGAADFITKPIDIGKLLESVRKNLLSDEGKEAPPATIVNRKKPCQTDELIGRSPQIVHLKELVDKIAPSDARVLIMGSNGTGKELVAHAIHNKSRRCNGPFVEVNCAAIPSELIESELFGHEKGAFTSAIKQRKGKFEQAIGGTLFLDEIGDMSLSAQAKVLRALQERKICRVGSDRDIDVDVRVVAATNKCLREEIAEGKFREDLYHRLSVIIVHVPSIAERREDIPPLIEYFVDKVCREYNIPIKSIEPSAVERLKNMTWTGNIREIRNVVERLIILSGTQISEADVDTYAETY
ncbi:MAG: sigma-54 dependent transcriptional regulator [Tidjanibacter sp.]|nr:sigma-54 dependent transcriptional regulator [Tidjanibacter sp.]